MAPSASACRPGVFLPAALGACLAVVGPGSAKAETSAALQLSAAIVSGCEINGALPADGQHIGSWGALDFGEHPSLATGAVTTSLTQAAGLTVRCTPGVTLTMTTDAGLHAGATRNLAAAGGSQLPYRLYADGGLAQELQPHQPIPLAFDDDGVVSLPIYGSLILPGNAAAGVYGDAVIITLNW